MDISLTYISSQILVIIYYIIYSFTFYLNDRNKILISGIIATIISSISYLLLGAYTGMAVCFVAIIRNLLFSKDRKNILNLVLIILLTIIASVITFNSYFCLFNIFGVIFMSIAFISSIIGFYKENNKLA